LSSLWFRVLTFPIRVAHHVQRRAGPYNFRIVPLQYLSRVLRHDWRRTGHLMKLGLSRQIAAGVFSFSGLNHWPDTHRESLGAAARACATVSVYKGSIASKTSEVPLDHLNASERSPASGVRDHRLTRRYRAQRRCRAWHGSCVPDCSNRQCRRGGATSASFQARGLVGTGTYSSEVSPKCIGSLLRREPGRRLVHARSQKSSVWGVGHTSGRAFRKDFVATLAVVPPRGAVRSPWPRPWAVAMGSGQARGLRCRRH
jgi:hypothetical protein